MGKKKIILESLNDDKTTWSLNFMEIESPVSPSFKRSQVRFHYTFLNIQLSLWAFRKYGR